MENSIVIVILVVLALALIYLLQTSEGFYGWVTNLWDNSKLTGWSPMNSQASYKNICLTCTPYGQPHPANKYFQTLETEFPKKYSYCDNYGCYGSAKVRNNGATTSGLSPAKSPSHSIELEYYQDAIGYCQRYPDRYPCPNHWVYANKKGHPLTSARKPTRETEDFSDIAQSIDNLVNSVEPQVITHCNNKISATLSKCSVNDNERMLMVYPDREDHATC